jgi:hypothetical protein
MGTNPPRQPVSAYPRTASILALVGGVIIIMGGALFVVVAAFVIPHLDLSNVALPRGVDRAGLPALISGVLGVMGSFGLVCGGVVLMSAVMLLAKVGQWRTWGVLTLVFSVLSFLGLGGFLIGAILGIVGGILTLRWKSPAPQ